MNKRSWRILIVTLLLMGSTSGLLGYWRTNQRLGLPGVKVVPHPTYGPQEKIIAKDSVYLPERVLDYQSESFPVSQQEYGMLPKDTTYGKRVYKGADGLRVWANVILMGTDRTSIHKPDYCLPGQGWIVDDRRKEETSVLINQPHPYRLPVMKWVVTGSQETTDGRKVEVRGIYVYWFVADKELTDTNLKMLLRLSRNLFLTGVLQRWAYVSYFAICMPGQEEATFDRMKQLIAVAVPEFQLTTGETVSGSMSGSGAPAIP